jgi:hypothetical protein
LPKLKCRPTWAAPLLCSMGGILFLARVNWSPEEVVVSSWREGASPRSQQDLDQLLAAVLGFAQQQLSHRGELYPYAAAIGDAGQAEMIAARPNSKDEYPLAADVVRSCRAALVSQRDYIRAGAVVATISLAEGGDAIRVDLEHAEGQALTVLLPYSRHRRHKSIEYGQLRAVVGERRVWPDQ